MLSSDSLFDNSVTNESSINDDTAASSSNNPINDGGSNIDAASSVNNRSSIEHEILPEVSSSSIVSYRLLVSRREAGAIIGKEGSNITRIRDEYGIKAGVSRITDGCIDRILSVSGTVENLPKALVEISKSVQQANLDTIADCERNGTNPFRLISYDYAPLKPLIARPNYKSMEYANTLFLRLILPNSQIGILIGKNGSRIKSIQEENNIKMVASKDFLKNSNERLIELQGTGFNLSNALESISKYLISDYQGSNSTINYYVACTPIDGRFRTNQSQSNYNNNVNNIPSIGSKEIIKKISFPNNYIGALIGKRGSRIQEIRVTSQCAVAIDNDNSDNDENEREITLVGTKYSVDKAIDMLNMYYEREQKRRASE